MKTYTSITAVSRIPSKGIQQGSVSFSKRQFGKSNAKAQEVRVRVHFPVASTAGNPSPVSVPHSLGKVPTHWDPVHVERDPVAGPPGTVYAIHPFASSSRATFLCTTADTWAEIILR